MRGSLQPLESKSDFAPTSQGVWWAVLCLPCYRAMQDYDMSDARFSTISWDLTGGPGRLQRCWGADLSPYR